VFCCSLAGDLIYQGTLYSDTKVEDWKSAAAESCIQPAHLMQLALQFWLQKREGTALEAEMLRFMELLKAICSLAGSHCHYLSDNQAACGIYVCH